MLFSAGDTDTEVRVVFGLEKFVFGRGAGPGLCAFWGEEELPGQLAAVLGGGHCESRGEPLLQGSQLLQLVLRPTPDRRILALIKSLIQPRHQVVQLIQLVNLILTPS
jgi:hypothetical protein